MGNENKLLAGQTVVVAGETDKGEAEIFKALVIKKAITGKSVLLVRFDKVDGFYKQYGPGWMGVVQQKEEHEGDVLRIDADYVFAPTDKVDQFVREYKALHDQCAVIDAQITELVRRHSFHVAGEEGKKKAKKAAKEAETAAKA